MAHPRGFHETLQHERARLQLRLSEVAQRCGVDKKVVHAWERGSAVPTRRQYAMILTIMRRVPEPSHWMTDGINPPDTVPFNPALPTNPLLVTEKAQPPAEKFGIALRRLREENGMTHVALAELLEVTHNAVRQWEFGKNYPVRENWDKLRAVLPELMIGIDIGSIEAPKSQEIPKPVGPPPGVESKKPLQILAETPRQATVAELSKLYGDSLVLKSVIDKSIAETETTLAKWRQQADETTAKITLVHEQLMTAVAREASKSVT